MSFHMRPLKFYRFSRGFEKYELGLNLMFDHSKHCTTIKINFHCDPTKAKNFCFQRFLQLLYSEKITNSIDYSGRIKKINLIKKDWDSL